MSLSISELTYQSQLAAHCWRVITRHFRFRNDLNPVNGTYPIEAMSHRSHGATDVKVTSNRLFQLLQFKAIAGPTQGTNGTLGPFCWSKSDFDSKVSHVGQPDCFDFGPVEHQWSLWQARVKNSAKEGVRGGNDEEMRVCSGGTVDNTGAPVTATAYLRAWKLTNFNLVRVYVIVNDDIVAHIFLNTYNWRRRMYIFVHTCFERQISQFCSPYYANYIHLLLLTHVAVREYLW